MKSKIDNINNNIAIGLEQLLIWTLISSLLILILFQTYSLIKKQALKLEFKTATLYNQVIADFFLRNKIEQAGYKGLVSSAPVAEQSTALYRIQTQKRLPLWLRSRYVRRW